MSRWLQLICFFTYLAGHLWAQQDRRVALVIGISAYDDHVGHLPKPLDDATSVGASLEKVGFTVTTLLDVTLNELVEGLKDFTTSVQRGDIVFVYYAGHGVQVNGTNYILPRNFSGSSSDLKTQAVPLDEVIQLLNGRAPKLKILVMDACRNNPFGAGPTGLAEMQAATYGPGTYIAMSAAPNQSALDGVFAKHLAATLQTPGLSVDEVFIRVRAAVLAESLDRQNPFSTDVQVENFYFRPTAKLPTESGPTRLAGAETAGPSPRVPTGFFGVAIPESDQYVRVSYSGFPPSITSGRALELYFRDYLKALWRLDESRVRQTLWLEATTDPNFADRQCASSLGFEVTIQYHFEDMKGQGITGRPAGSVRGMACYGSVAAETEKAATDDAIKRLRDVIFRQ
jgi:hypothetical protein